MKRHAAGSALFGAILLMVFFSFDRAQTVIGTAEFQQERQTKKAENNNDQTESVSEILKQSLVPEETDVLGVPFKATAYCLRGRTASGKFVRKGIIAADPRVLPLGTNVTILHGPYAGDYLVADTGGKIKGKRIDIWMASCSEAIRFGYRSVMLRVPERADG
jgi:3D (Asp-Asp-Asp) domain-containing protein